MTGWKCSGDWVVQDGGHGTEKTFVTSFMECWKRQDVTLTDHFTAEYLDTQPDIQVRYNLSVNCCLIDKFQLISVLTLVYTAR